MSAAEVIRWDVPGPYAVAFSTRRGGVSEGPYASLNVARKGGDDPARVDENRSRLCAEVAAEPARLAVNYQIHSRRVRRAIAGERGEPGDGLWTDEPGIPVLALTADCLPVALVRSNGRLPAVAVLHAGRIGILAEILSAGVAALGPGRISAAIGPSIGPCCYEIGDEVASRYRARFGSSVLRGGRLDLWSAAEQALREAGCASIERFDLCTACDPERFFSYRRDGKPRGGQGVVALVA